MRSPRVPALTPLGKSHPSTDSTAIPCQEQVLTSNAITQAHPKNRNPSHATPVPLKIIFEPPKFSHEVDAWPAGSKVPSNLKPDEKQSRSDIDCGFQLTAPRCCLPSILSRGPAVEAEFPTVIGVPAKLTQELVGRVGGGADVEGSAWSGSKDTNNEDDTGRHMQRREANGGNAWGSITTATTIAPTDSGGIDSSVRSRSIQRHHSTVAATGQGSSSSVAEDRASHHLEQVKYFLMAVYIYTLKLHESEVEMKLEWAVGLLTRIDWDEVAINRSSMARCGWPGCGQKAPAGKTRAAIHFMLDHPECDPDAVESLCSARCIELFFEFRSRLAIKPPVSLSAITPSLAAEYRRARHQSVPGFDDSASGKQEASGGSKGGSRKLQLPAVSDEIEEIEVDPDSFFAKDDPKATRRRSADKSRKHSSQKTTDESSAVEPSIPAQSSPKSRQLSPADSFLRASKSTTAAIDFEWNAAPPIIDSSKKPAIRAASTCRVGSSRWASHCENDDKQRARSDKCLRYRGASSNGVREDVTDSHDRESAEDDYEICQATVVGDSPIRHLNHCQEGGRMRERSQKMFAPPGMVDADLSTSTTSRTPMSSPKSSKRRHHFVRAASANAATVNERLSESSPNFVRHHQSLVDCGKCNRSHANSKWSNVQFADQLNYCSNPKFSGLRQSSASVPLKQVESSDSDEVADRLAPHATSAAHPHLQRRSPAEHNSGRITNSLGWRSNRSVEFSRQRRASATVLWKSSDTDEAAVRAAPHIPPTAHSQSKRHGVDEHDDVSSTTSTIARPRSSSSSILFVGSRELRERREEISRNWSSIHLEREGETWSSIPSRHKIAEKSDERKPECIAGLTDLHDSGRSVGWDADGATATSDDGGMITPCCSAGFASEHRSSSLGGGSNSQESNRQQLRSILKSPSAVQERQAFGRRITFSSIIDSDGAAAGSGVGENMEAGHPEEIPGSSSEQEEERGASSLSLANSSDFSSEPSTEPLETKKKATCQDRHKLKPADKKSDPIEAFTAAVRVAGNKAKQGFAFDDGEEEGDSSTEGSSTVRCFKSLGELAYLHFPSSSSSASSDEEVGSGSSGDEANEVSEDNTSKPVEKRLKRRVASARVGSSASVSEEQWPDRTGPSREFRLSGRSEVQSRRRSLGCSRKEPADDDDEDEEEDLNFDFRPPPSMVPVPRNWEHKQTAWRAQALLLSWVTAATSQFLMGNVDVEPVWKVPRRSVPASRNESAGSTRKNEGGETETADELGETAELADPLLQAEMGLEKQSVAMQRCQVLTETLLKLGTTANCRSRGSSVGAPGAFRIPRTSSQFINDVAKFVLTLRLDQRATEVSRAEAYVLQAMIFLLMTDNEWPSLSEGQRCQRAQAVSRWRASCHDPAELEEFVLGAAGGATSFDAARRQWQLVADAVFGVCDIAIVETE